MNREEEDSFASTALYVRTYKTVTYGHREREGEGGSTSINAPNVAPFLLL